MVWFNERRGGLKWEGSRSLVSQHFVVLEPFEGQKLFIDLKSPVEDGSDESGGRRGEKRRDMKELFPY